MKGTDYPQGAGLARSSSSLFRKYYFYAIIYYIIFYIFQAIHGNQLTAMKTRDGRLLVDVVQENTRVLERAERQVTQVSRAVKLTQSRTIFPFKNLENSTVTFK